MGAFRSARRVGAPLSFVAALAVAAVVLAGCGSGSSSGPATLNLWVFREPSGSFTDAAARCTDQSGGRYRIVFHALSNSADQQRDALVRRLAAKDSSIDIAGMDVVWTAEFASAGWIKPWPAQFAAPVRRGTLAGPLKTATYRGRLRAAPANTNTQLLWYRKDLVPHPAAKWDGLITQASKLPKDGRIEIQGAQYEGVVVWFNSLVQSAGGSIVQGNKVTLGPSALTAARIMRRLGTSPAADPSISAQMEDQNRLAFEQGNAAFEVNYPFIYPSARQDAPQLFKQIGWRPYPAVSANRPAKARSAASTGASARSPSIPRRRSRRPPACATPRTSVRRRSRAGCRRRSRSSTTRRASGRRTRSPT
jgi:multiple sugar transport system substrate-binding protein